MFSPPSSPNRFQVPGSPPCLLRITPARRPPSAAAELNRPKPAYTTSFFTSTAGVLRSIFWGIASLVKRPRATVPTDCDASRSVSGCQ